MSGWKVIALKSPRQKYHWVAQGVTDHTFLDRIANSKKVIQRYIEEARKGNIWLMHRRKPEQHTWELVWKWRRKP
jgi:hypothetical protein